MSLAEGILFRETTSSVEKVYCAHRVDAEGATVQVHCIVADDDEDAIYLAETVGGIMRVDLWQGSRLVKVIDSLRQETNPAGHTQ